jgi:hypothetical protein
MSAAFAGLAGVFAWVGWFAVSPALGLPSLGPAAMFNRVVAPRADSGYWLGWALLIVALAIAVFVYLAAVRAKLWRATIVTGLAYGAACWLFAGAAVMPLLGFLDPFPVPAPPATPDAMHGTLMMLHLGIGAPLAALVPWLMLGGVLGATAGWQPDYSRRSWALLFGAAAVFAILVAVGVSLPNTPPATSLTSGTRPLSSGPVAALPEGTAFISVFRLPQPAGAALGPHAHVSGFACALRGAETMTFADATTIRVPAGEAGFMGAQQLHTHLNSDGVLPAGIVAVLLIVLAVVVGLLGAQRSGAASRLLLVGLVGLVALGAVAAWNPWSNDWLFISVRPAAARGGPMPLPSASRVYESADLAALPPGPYIETVAEVTVASGSVTTIQSAGASLLLVIDGQALVRSPNATSTVLGVQQASMLQPGSTAEISSAGERTVRLLEFTVAPAP